MYSKSLESNNWYSNSDIEPTAITKNRFNSALLFHPQPSAILVGTEELDLLIWDISPYNSSFGKDDFVSAYIFKVSSWLLCQKTNCLKFLIN
jgi:hypothetical protein